MTRLICFTVNGNSLHGFNGILSLMKGYIDGNGRKKKKKEAIERLGLRATLVREEEDQMLFHLISSRRRLWPHQTTKGD